MAASGSTSASEGALIGAIVDFDDLGPSDRYEPGAYRGMDWSDFAVLSTMFSPGGGFTSGATSGGNVAFNFYARDAEIADETDFNFRSAALTGAWNDGLGVTVSGYHDGVLKYSVTVTVDTAAPSVFTFDFLGIDRLTFHSEGGRPADPDAVGSGTHFVIDDMAFEVAPAAISGAIWNDADGDGTHGAGEGGLGGRTVILDDDGNGRLDAGEAFAVTREDGGYDFTAVAPGAHSVTQVLPDGWVARGAERARFSVDSGETGHADFLAAERAAIAGSVGGVLFHDENRDGVRGGDEAGIAGWRVYLDADGDGRLDDDEVSKLTDEAGAYSFSDVLPGSVTVAVATPGSEWENWHASPAATALPAAGDATVELAVTGGATRFGDAIRARFGIGGQPDVIHALAGDDVVVSLRGADRLFGEQGNDWLRGGRDDDTLRGGDGDDRLSGGGGDDRLWGGAGADVFIFRDAAGRDTVADFDVALDRIRIDVAGFDELAIASRDGGAVIAWGGANEAFLRGVDAEAITADLFRFGGA